MYHFAYLNDFATVLIAINGPFAYLHRHIPIKMN